MEVSQKGDIIYAFPRDIQRQATRLDSQRPALISRAQTAARACIGLMLLASVAVMRPLLASDSDAQHVNLRRELRMLRHAVLGQQRGRLAVHDAAAVDAEVQQRQLEQCLSLACYAFLFGDEGGREGIATERRERQYAAIAGCIRAHRGAVCAEQLRPFLLDLPTSLARQADAAADVEADADADGTGALWLSAVEPWLLPILSRFDGRPVATDDGEIIYTFPELLPTTTRNRQYGLYPTSAPLVRGAGSVLRRLSGPSAERFDYLEEPLRRFTSRADPATQRKVWAVAWANWGAVVLLGALLGPLQLYLRAASRGASMLTLVNVAYGGLLVNGLTWLLLPTARCLDVFVANWAVRSANRRRRRLAAEVLAAATPLTPLSPRGKMSRLARGLRAAKGLRVSGRGNEVTREEVLYTTAKDVVEQAAVLQPTRDAWDATLNAHTKGRTERPRMLAADEPRRHRRRRVMLQAALAAAAGVRAFPRVVSAAAAPSALSRVSYDSLEACPATSKRLILCRHGQTLLNQLGLPQGRLIDAPLSGTGRAQAAALAAALARGQPLAVVGSSPRLRAIQTADAISEALSAAPRATPCVREGSRVDLDEVEDLLVGDLTYAYVDTRLRAAAVLIALRRALQPGEAGAWVSHSRFLRVVLAAAAAEEAKARGGEAGTAFLTEWKAAFPPGYLLGNAAITVIDIAEDGDFRLRCANSVAHLS